jgi:hypothetical protein
MKYHKEHQEIKPQTVAAYAELSLSEDESVLDDTELEAVSGGITPIPIPYVGLNSTILNQSLKNYLSSKGFEGGGGLG